MAGNNQNDDILFLPQNTDILCESLPYQENEQQERCFDLSIYIPPGPPLCDKLEPSYILVLFP